MADDWVVVEAIALIVLAGITAFYALATHRILKETVKDRKVRRIEKALEDFYLPLLEVKDLYRYPYPPEYMLKLKVLKVAIPQDVKPYGGLERVSRKFWFDVNRHRYLAERGIVEVLDSFLEYSNHYWAQAPFVEAKGDLDTATEKLIKEVRNDIKTLEERLKGLHR